MAGPPSHNRVPDLLRVLARPWTRQNPPHPRAQGLKVEPPQTGPWRERPGYDFMIQGMSGMMSITGERDDLPGGGPQKAGIPISDIITGMYAAVAVCAALAHRAETGRGQHLDLALLDSTAAILANQGANYLATGAAPG